MMTFLHPGFLTDPQQYAKAEAVWRSRWQQLLEYTGQEENWQYPWINNTFADGAPCRDGNPIFSGICPERRLGVRVIQQEPADDPRELNFWTNTFAEGDPLATRELVISCVLTNETLNDVSDLLYQWITTEEVQILRVGYHQTTGGRVRSCGNIPVIPTTSSRLRARRLETVTT